MKINLLFILIFIGLWSCSLNATQKGIEICDNGILLSVSPDAKHLLIFYNEETSIDGDFDNGWIYIYDLIKHDLRLFYPEKCVFEFVKTQWLDSENIMISEGEKIIQININKKKEKLIFHAKDSLIYDFTVSKDGSRMLFDILDDTQEKAYQIVYLMDIKKNQKEEIYRIYDPRMGGGFNVNYVFFGDEPKNIYIINMQRELLSISLEDKTIKTIDQDIAPSANQIIFSSGLLFYAKSMGINAYNLESGEKIPAIKSDKEQLRLDYLGKGERGNVYIAISDIVILYNFKEKISNRIDLPIIGPIVYCNDHMAIQSVKVPKPNDNRFKLILYNF
ncbi:MAG: hypothetical protein MUP71_11795 [Candidatus Aminicenantes bacterium]|nr:hypothetical protein [Candidatus Aminicenantes bacterium]